MRHKRWNERHAYAGEAALTPPQVVRIVLAECKRRGLRFHEAWWLAEDALPWYPGKRGGAPQNQTVKDWLADWHSTLVECRPWFKAAYEDKPFPKPLADEDVIEPTDADMAALAAAFAAVRIPEPVMAAAGEWAPEGLDLD